MFTLIILGLMAWFAYRHFANKKREADRRSWSVDFRNSNIRSVTRRLPWKDL
jgi:predicted negative regulator of RcsB-dependent stress response